ncbi:MAG TPA: hypothetical protein VFD15_06820, partial [Clostridia bacterium]|nr:hypothetical protein [Clostridia bacterium]
EIYNEIIEREGKQFLVPMWGFFAIVPEVLRVVWDTLRVLEVDEGHVDRKLMSAISMLAAENVGCKRCANYHEETLVQRMDIDREWAEKVKDFENSDLPEKEKAIYRLAKKVAFGEQLTQKEFEDVRSFGYTDEQIVEIATIALFESSMARHAHVLAQFEDGLDWPMEYTPSSTYGEVISGEED